MHKLQSWRRMVIHFRVKGSKNAKSQQGELVIPVHFASLPTHSDVY